MYFVRITLIYECDKMSCQYLILLNKASRDINEDRQMIVSVPVIERRPSCHRLYQDIMKMIMTASLDIDMDLVCLLLQLVTIIDTDRPGNLKLSQILLKVFTHKKNIPILVLYNVPYVGNRNFDKRVKSI